ncbi:MAG: hypothetical protein ABEJ31_09515 [Haloarculaceae archaeon]
MAQDATPREAGTDCEVMGSIDRGTVERFIVADPSRDDVWVSVRLADAAALSDWR